MTTFLKKPTTFLVAEPRFKSLEGWIGVNSLYQTSLDPTAPLHDLAAEQSYEGERLVEFAGRHCYRSWSEGRERDPYILNLIESKHGSVLEHANYSFAIQGVSRTLSHEMVRHRVGVAISQESQRYVDADGINFVIPPIMLYLSDEEQLARFEAMCTASIIEYKYHQSIFGSMAEDAMRKRINEAARAILPNAAETRLTWTANIRTLRHFFSMRGGRAADLEIRRLAYQMFELMASKAPIFFEDFRIAGSDYGVPYLEQVKL